MSKQKIRWLITHEPQELFIRAARCFEQKLDAKLPGKFELETHNTGPTAKKMLLQLNFLLLPFAVQRKKKDT